MILQTNRPAAKTQVAAWVQALLDQVKGEAAEKYETDIQAKDIKIQALMVNPFDPGGMAVRTGMRSNRWLIN